MSDQPAITDQTLHAYIAARALREAADAIGAVADNICALPHGGNRPDAVELAYAGGLHAAAARLLARAEALVAEPSPEQPCSYQKPDDPDPSRIRVCHLSEGHPGLHQEAAPAPASGFAEPTRTE